MLAQILSDEIAKDVAGAEAQVARTADLKAEIDTREDRFVSIKSTSELLIKQGHFAKKEVRNYSTLYIYYNKGYFGHYTTLCVYNIYILCKHIHIHV